MKVLYLAGLDSRPRPDKMQVLQELGFEVTELVPDYRTLREKTFELILDTAKAQKVELVIGSSMGGFFGFWTAEKLGLPCLLFNPAMQFRSLEIDLPHFEIGNCPKRIVVLGEQDKVVNPTQNWAFFQSIESETTIQKVVTCSWLGHQIDMDTFGDMAQLAARNFIK